MDKFCGTAFWDNNLTWNTTDPYFTFCFEETTLVLTPALFLIIFALLDLSYSWKSESELDSTSGWSAFTIIKCTLSLMLVAISMTQLIRVYVHSKVDGNDQVFTSDVLAPVARAVAFAITIVLICVAKQKEVRSSGIQFLFWFGLVICDSILYRSAYKCYILSSTSSKHDVGYLTRMISFPFVVIQFILHCFADLSPSANEKVFGNPSPETDASFLSKCLYTWFDGVAWSGYKTPLRIPDLWDLSSNDTSSTQVALFGKHWERAKASADKSNERGRRVQASIVAVLWKCYGGTFMLAGGLKLVQDLLVFVQPVMLKLLIDHVTVIPRTATEESWKGFLYAAVLFICSIAQTMLGVQHSQRMLMIGMRVRTALSASVYRKAMLVCNSARNECKSKKSSGEVINLMSVDTQRIMDLMPVVHMIWTSPIQLTLTVYFLYLTLGGAVFAGLGVMLALIPVNGAIARKARDLEVQLMVVKDQRVKLMSEVLAGMKVLKLYAWEPYFEAQISGLRAKEAKLLRSSLLLMATADFMFQMVPTMVSLATFAVYVLPNETHVLNAGRAFVSLALFNILRTPMSMLPSVISRTVQAAVSAQRLNKYMNSEEIDPSAVTHNEDEECPLIIRGGSFSWTEQSQSQSLTLSNINLNVRAGSLVAVVGAVGSGKSSLLHALLGDLIKHQGEVNTKGSMAYVAQVAWIQNATLRDNILFGDQFNESKYNRILESCALQQDLQILVDGDQTEIGEKGINLSGGQKQRVSLARAAYKNSDVYLFDDSLSAVDSHVGKHIFEALIGPTGYLRSKTRLFVTHNLSYLHRMDGIVVMKDGCVSEFGTYKELLRKKGQFAEFLLQHLVSHEGDDDEGELVKEIMVELEEVVGSDEIRKRSSLNVNKLEFERRRASLEPGADADVTVPHCRRLIEDEEAETGNVQLSVYVNYVKGAGITMVAGALVLNVLFHAAATYSNIWLANWSFQATKDEIRTGKQDRATTNKYLSWYGLLGIVQGIAILVGTIALALATLRAALGLHNVMLSRALRAPMFYFDTTPLGRLVNRFAKDMEMVDGMIPVNVRATLNILLSVFATLLIISYSTPLFLAVIIPVMIFYLFLQRIFVATARQLKRLESITRSPIYSQFAETLSGVTTIRAFGLQDDFITASENKIDFNQKCYYPFIAANMWISVRLEVIGGVIILLAAIFAVLARESINPGAVGLSISYALQIASLFNFSVRLSTELETNVVALERMMELTEIPQEAGWSMPKTAPGPEWPESGAIEFRAYETRYRQGLDLVLKGISCRIEAGEKVGIVGRSGAGKSSLTLALFRLVESTGGSIYIDGRDVAKIGLHELRSKITIIPQDPVLFSGTLRVNLDPFNHYTDNEVRKCLELAHLKTFVTSLNEGLLYEVAEEGQNFSCGQRQLICLARALLRKTRILVLDEATAAVDLETDGLIQKTIQIEFEQSTVITIAHRLHTILDSSRVIVLDKGEIREFDTPANLLTKSDSMFYAMMKDAGLV